MPCRQSSLASVPPPAPEPTTTTTSASSWSKCRPLTAARPSSCALVTLPFPAVSGISALLFDARVRQPVEVGEAPVQVAALLEGRALVTEQRPHLRVVVEREDRLRADGLEERGAAHPAQDGARRLGVQLGERRAARDVEQAHALRELGPHPDVVLG